MSTRIDAERDGTVAFLPHRLNRQPTIVRGLTADELWITVGMSGMCGLVLGIGIATLTGRVPMVPTTIAASIAVGIFAGGALLRRHKRGRPDTWLYRRLQWRLSERVPAIRRYIGAADLIARSGVWSTRRSLRR